MQVFETADAPSPFCEALFYTGTPENPHYLGDAPVSALALQVHRSKGTAVRAMDSCLVESRV